MLIDTDEYTKSGIKAIVFPGGEVHAEVPLNLPKVVNVFAKMRCPKDWMLFLAVLDAMKRRGTFAHVFMPYLPAARQDRYQDGFAFTAVMYARALEESVISLTAIDPHSEKAFAIYDKYVRVNVVPLGEIARYAIDRSYDVVMAPDKGATERALEVASAIGAGSVVHCLKNRDPHTGVLSGFQVPDLPKGTTTVLLADDICDGGGTFVGILGLLQEKYPDVQADLWVTHGIFSKGLSVLGGFHRIYTTNSWCKFPVEANAPWVTDVLPFWDQP